MRPRLAAIGLAGALLLAGPATAQQAAPAAGPGGGGEPIEIVSDRLVLEQNQQVATFIGHVDAVQGETRLRADKMRVFYTSNDSGQASGRMRCTLPRRLAAPLPVMPQGPPAAPAPHSG